MTRTNFNQAPYYNSYEAGKNYLMVLHKPGFAVQGRELNEAQSIMLGQMGAFADHVFKNGSKVSNARSTILVSNYARLRAQTPGGEVVNVEQFPEGTIVEGAASGLRARIVMAVNAENADPATLFLSYINTAVDGETTEFVPGEDLHFKDSNDVTVYTATMRCPGCAGSAEGSEVYPTGRGHLFSIDEGIFYFESMFLRSARQQVVVSKYSYPKGEAAQPFAGAKVGFDFVQSIVTSDDDPSLADPSLGYPNATAPGADRYKAELLLSRRSYDSEDGENFLLLGRVNGNYVAEFMKSDAEYASLYDNLAKERFETNGNYTVRPFKLSFYEHKKKNAADPLGWDVNGSEANIVGLVTPSVGYVRGYRVESIADTPVLVPKARATRKLPSYVKLFNDRSYVSLRPTSDIVWPGLSGDQGIVNAERVAMYDSTNAAGAIIGYARFNDFEKIAGQNSDKSAIYKYTVVDLAFTVTGKTLRDVKSFGHLASGFRADSIVTASSGDFEVTNPNTNDLVFGIDKANIKSLRDSDNALNGSMSITIRKKMKATLDSAGKYEFTTGTNEFFTSLSGRTLAYTTSGSNVVKTFDLNGSNASITATSMLLNFGAAEAGKTVTVFADVLKTSQKEKTKTLISRTYTTNVAPVNIVGTKIFLGVADSYDLTKIELYDHTNPSSPTLLADVTSNYKMDTGSNNWFYGESSVVLQKAMSQAITGDMRLHVTFRYFEHSGNEGFFTVDSYSDVINDPANSLGYADIPVFVSSTGAAIPLINAIDFRPIMIAGATTGTVPSVGTTSIFDMEYYLPRADIIQINKDGLIYAKLGNPSDTPALPQPDADAMVLYHVFLNPYTYSMNDVSMKFIENKRYTMRDIGRIEERLKNVEYFTSLSLLEKTAESMSIKDENGLDRYKNGFIADNFSDWQAADLSNVEFNAAADRGKRVLRPRFKASNIKLVPNKDSSVGVQWKGNIAMLPYVNEVSSENPFATKHLSINPYFIYNKKGSVVLSPNVDTWTDETRLPEVVTNVDTGVEGLRKIADAAGLLGTSWGSWTAQNATVVGSSTTRNSTIDMAMLDRQGAIVTWQSTTTESVSTVETTSTTMGRTGRQTTVTGEGTEYTIDDIVKDVQILPYARSRVIQFYATNLRPNTRVYVYFDGEKVSEFARNIGTTLNTDNANTQLGQIAWGSPLYTDSTGSIIGELNLPAGRFFTGKSEFRISDDSIGKFDPDMETTSAVATYFSGGLDITKQDSTLNIITPTLSEVDVSETRESVSTRVVGSQVVSQQVDVFTSVDPVAQQFFVDEDQLLTGVDIYLQAIDMTSDVIWVELRSMVNGYPSNAAMARREFKPSQLVASDDSSVAQHVEFFTPVFVQGGGNYCFVVGGASPNTRIWLAKLGEEVVNMPGKIVETQPTLGSSFRSQNGVTWNAEQFETIKYKLYRARCSADEMTVVMESEYEDAGAYVLEANPLETQAGSDLVRVYWDSHGFTENDRVTLSLYDSAPLKIRATALPPQIGQFLHTDTGSGYIKTIKKDTAGTADDYIVEMDKTTGRFLQGQAYTADPAITEIKDNLLLANAGIAVPQVAVINKAVGTVIENPLLGAYFDGKVNGIDIQELSREHVVRTVDSANSFIIQVTTPATATGRSGGADIRCFDFNLRYETFNVSGAYLPYSSVENWQFIGTGHGTANSIFAGDNYVAQAPQSFFPGRDYASVRPFKMAGKTNEERVFGTSGQKSIKVTATFRTRNALLMPVVDVNTFSTIAVTNRVDFNTAEEFNVAPNATNRLVPETDPLNGSATYKYVTKNVRLENPAADIYIYLDYFKDVNSDFEIYVKKIPTYNAQPVDSIPWVKLNIPSKKNSADIAERIEGAYQCSELVAGWNDADGNPIPFSSYKVKIVGYARNTARPPLFENLRAIAVT
ncbi:virulence-associated VriC protein [Acidovorax phage ACP17]|uniref:Virulence-associated VriC protein n=1 Tax=Acidovorax phage ACP17 TaxID=2010329 RepID=A0A218M2U5_9CAUD|nr:virulence-associated VriC protein [Acidovorax phage ACP17]ASD50360.1 virulence-associated VriC protein [Acidovorax phage ACP17]